MFNVHVFDQKLNARREAERQQLHELLKRQKKVSERATLTANYARRVDQFMVRMANDPIQLGQHISPMAVVPRDSNPAKYKGAARMILKTNLNRSMNASKAEDTKPVAAHAKVEKLRVFLKRGTGMVRIKRAERKARLSILGPRRREQSESQIAAQLESASGSERSETAEEKPKPAHVFTGLYKKTHFKGVMSRLVEKSSSHPVQDTEDFEENGMAFHRSRTASILWRHSKVLKRVYLKEDESSTLAKEILEACNVIPRSVNSSFLRKGEGKLTSNPQTQLSVVYKRLHDSRSDSYLL